MRPKSSKPKTTAEKVGKDIRRATRRLLKLPDRSQPDSVARQSRPEKRLMSAAGKTSRSTIRWGKAEMSQVRSLVTPPHAGLMNGRQFLGSRFEDRMSAIRADTVTELRRSRIEGAQPSYKRKDHNSRGRLDRDCNPGDAYRAALLIPIHQAWDQDEAIDRGETEHGQK